MEESFPDRVGLEPERVAHHCAEGGLYDKAAHHLEAAGQRSVARHANSEAVDYFRRGLECLEHAEEDSARHAREISLRVGLGGALGSLEGHQAADVVENYRRVRELADLIGEGPQQLAAWIGLVHFYSTTAAMRELRNV